MKVEDIDFRHIMQWLMFLMVWLILIEVYSGQWIFDILKWIITGFFVVWFLFDVKRYFE